MQQQFARLLAYHFQISVKILSEHIHNDIYLLKLRDRYGKGYPIVESLVRAEIFAALKIRHNGAAVGFCGENIAEKYFKNNEINVKIL